MNNKFQGTGVALITPFKTDLTVDYNALTRLVEYNIENGTNYLVVSGTTGESATITREEKQKILDVVVKTTQGRVPIVLGIGGNNTASVIEEIATTNLNDVDAILSVSPYYSKPTQEGIYQHFKSVAKASPIPVILYNVPGRTASNMLPDTILRLAKDFKNIIGVKEAAGNMSQYVQLIKNKPEDFLIISGDDDLALGVVLAGGAGVISVIGQAFPEAFSKMIQLGLQQKTKDAYKIHFKLLDIITYIFSENNPAGIKAVLAEQNLCHATVRLPLVEATSKLKKQIANYIKTV